MPVGYCVTSLVEPERGLTYVGRPIADLVGHSPIDVIYLLYHGKEGSADEVRSFQGELNQRAQCTPQTLEAITKLPRKGHAMDMLAAALLILGMCEGKGDYREDR